jgi:hypothetical protein
MGFGLKKTKMQNVELLYPLKMVRIEMQLTEEEVAIIEQIAKEEGRSRKKQCEVYIRKMISDYKRKRSN